jgi:H/ACA ribonucleoprotein complex subunit 3
LKRKKVHSNLREKNQRKPEKIKMRFQLRKCSKCNHYTLKEKCPKCNEETISVHPAKFSPDDKYMRYRLAERYS